MMQIKRAFYILAAVTMASCSTPIVQTKSIEDKFTDIIKKNITDNAITNTADVKIYSLNILKIDTITSNTLDSQLVIKTLDRFEICNAMADLYQSMSETNTRIKALDKRLKNKVLPATTSNDIEDDVSKAQVYKDSANYYHLLLDSLNQIRLHNARFSDTLYRVRSFLKATEKKNNDSTNHFGIRYFYITKADKVLYLSDIEAGKLQRLTIPNY